MPLLAGHNTHPGQQTPDFTASAHTVAPVQEIFSSIQGEGPYIGVRQAFVRFAHCHLKCAYCDTPMQSETGECFIETIPDNGHSDRLQNPVPVETLFSAVERLLVAVPHHSVSFTGGEPLLYHRYLAELMPKIQAVPETPKVKTYLETSGTQAEFLATVLPFTDIIAMDIKLPSSTKEADRFAEHRRFYDMAKSRPEAELFIKLVFNEYSTFEEMDAVIDIVSDRKTPIILQPETVLNASHTTVTPVQMGKLQAYLARHFDEVRVIPQSHKMLKVL